MAPTGFAAQTKCPVTLKDTENIIPFPFYEEMRGQGGVHWDPSVNAWLITSQQGCRELFSKDKVLFRHPDGDAGGDYAAIANGRRALKTLLGEEHRKLHNWLLGAFSAKQATVMMESFVHDVIADALDGLAGKSRVNLLTDFVDRIPVRVIAAALDLPWRDEQFIARATQCMNRLADFFNRRMVVTEVVSSAAKVATEDMRALLDPWIEARSDGSGEDLISRMWRDGPGMVPGWNAEDIFVHLNTVFLGGFDTSTLAISNALYVALRDPVLADTLRTGDKTLLARFVEEVLRSYPPIHYRARRANEDTEILGVPIQKDDFVIPLLAAANRDPTHYDRPNELELDRKSPRDHLTFIAGPRSCVGSGLARAEIIETVRAFLEAYPNARLDADTPAPEYLGLTMRRFEPINIVLE